MGRRCAARRLGDPLAEYINDCYRSLKNDRDGLALAATLDAAESCPPLLRAVFAIHGRVCPYNRHLVFELAHEPLPGGGLTTDELLAGVRALTSGAATPAVQRSLLSQVARLARDHGHGEIVDSWADRPELSAALHRAG